MSTTEHTGATRQRLRTVRLSQEEIGELLDDLDRNDGVNATGGSSGRYRCRVPALRVRLQQPGGSMSLPLYVPARWLSETGIAFLHGYFVYKGTYCVTQLITLHGNWNDVQGSVSTCRYIEGHVHEVEVRFLWKIDPSLYCVEAATCRVLLAEDDPLVARMISTWLTQLNAKVDLAENGQQALDQANRHHYDLVLMDMEMPVMDGFEAVRILREQGHLGVIVAITSLTRPENKRRCLEVGCDQFWPKPFGKDELVNLFQTLRGEPIFSTLQDDPSMTSLIQEFVSQLMEQARAIRQAIARGDAAQVQQVARQLKGQGSLYGFEMISKASNKIESGLTSGGSLQDVRGDLDELLKWCAQVRAPGQ